MLNGAAKDYVGRVHRLTRSADNQWAAEKGNGPEPAWRPSVRDHTTDYGGNEAKEARKYV